MNRPIFFQVLLIFIVSLLLPTILFASTANSVGTHALRDKQLVSIFLPRQEKEKRDRKEKKQEPRQATEKPDIREVPKARRQTRPPVVVKPNIKPKPVKVIRPKIKRP